MSFTSVGNASAYASTNPYLHTMNGITADLENLLRETSMSRATQSKRTTSEEKQTCARCKLFADEAVAYIAAIETANGRIKIAKQRILEGKKESESMVDEILRLKLDYARLRDETQQLKENLAYYKRVSVEYKQALDNIRLQAVNVIKQ